MTLSCYGPNLGCEKGLEFAGVDLRQQMQQSAIDKFFESETTRIRQEGLPMLLSL